MKWYANYWFVKNPDTEGTYVLVKEIGGSDKVKFPTYSKLAKKEYIGKPYIRFAEPRDPGIKQYFAHTFELAQGKVLTSTEEIDSSGRVFGDMKRVGLNDLVLGKFSPDRDRLVIWLVRDKGVSRAVKTEAFKRWCNGEELVQE